MKFKTNLKLLLVIGAILVSMCLVCTRVKAAETTGDTNSTTQEQNETDKQFIENLLKELGFKVNANGVYQYSYTECVELGKEGYIEEQEVYKSIQNAGIELVEVGGSGSYGGGSGGYELFKNGISYGYINISVSRQYKVIVPDSIEDTETAYLNYAKQKIEDYVEIDKNSGEYVTLDKISGYWYECSTLETQVMIKKANGTYIGENIYADNLEIGVDVSAKEQNNTVMITEVTDKGYSKILGSYEITLTGKDKLTSPISLTFNVGTQYNGETVYILHQKKDGTYENFEKIVINGKVTITVSELSPFVLGIKEVSINNDSSNNNSNSNNNSGISNNNHNSSNNSNTGTTTPAPNKGELDETPKTGAVDIINYILLIAIISATGIIVLKRKETK